MMEPSFSRMTSVLMLSLVRLLERAGYYGMRGMIVLYAIDESGLSLDNSTALTYYGLFTGLLYISFVPMGLLSDLLFKQKNGVLFGFGISTLGYLCLVIPNQLVVLLGLLIIALGIGLNYTEYDCFIGRLFRKDEEKRNIAFIVYLIAITIGAIISAPILFLMVKVMAINMDLPLRRPFL